MTCFSARRLTSHFWAEAGSGFHKVLSVQLCSSRGNDLQRFYIPAPGKGCNAPLSSADIAYSQGNCVFSHNQWSWKPLVCGQVQRPFRVTSQFKNINTKSSPGKN
ncbi:hypothetical protein X474_03510 [Dethiosulfatarculus sandiegensis]|uniref:Uncharacterized protein n=1 Tax=Dethiosulfatarculus sandiegensis TaxID=1429043 RepID=A0A0D2GKZ3_9BACT|nr:hypothetical protein X474_03510 [Dethiosulfatarculus sandiegensis]